MHFAVGGPFAPPAGAFVAEPAGAAAGVFVAAAGVLAGASVVAPAAGGAVAAADVVADPPWPVSMPPWPLHAPWPPLLFVPSLQVTSSVDVAPAAVDVAAGALAVGAAAVLDDPPQLVGALVFVAFFGFGSLAGAAAVLGVLEALLSTPPWPLQAPFPAWLFVPSLQVTSAAGSAALVTRGDTIASATSATDARTIRATITELPC